MPKRLVVVRGPDQGRVFPLPESDSLLLGRSRATATRLVDPHVSRVHCEVLVDGDRVSVHDFDSPHGTFVNGGRVASQELRPGDVIRVGETELRYEVRQAAAPTGPPAPPPPGPPAGDVVFAGRPAARPIAAPLQRLQDLAGRALGHYQLLRVLGVGQIGVVFEAQDTKDGGRVALKVLKPDFAQDERAVQRFIRGLRAARALDHPNLVTLHHAGNTGPYWWLALELVEGESLAEQMQRRGPRAPLEWHHVLRVAVHVSRALAYAHENQVVHRNVLPQNILIRTADQVAKLGDLLLAKELEGAFGPQVTRTGELVGNLFYMPPERTQGTGGDDPRSDLYSLGVTTYQALTGRQPFAGVNMMEVITRIRTAAPERPTKVQPEVPAPLEHAVLKALAKRPEDRQQTAAELLAELEQVARLEGVPV
jgi:serine/threonine protein kinase